MKTVVVFFGALLLLIGLFSAGAVWHYAGEASHYQSLFLSISYELKDKEEEVARLEGENNLMRRLLKASQERTISEIFEIKTHNVALKNWQQACGLPKLAIPAGSPTNPCTFTY